MKVGVAYAYRGFSSKIIPTCTFVRKTLTHNAIYNGTLLIVGECLKNVSA